MCGAWVSMRSAPRQASDRERQESAHRWHIRLAASRKPKIGVAAVGEFRIPSLALANTKQRKTIKQKIVE